MAVRPHIVQNHKALLARLILKSRPLPSDLLRRRALLISQSPVRCVKHRFLFQLIAWGSCSQYSGGSIGKISRKNWQSGPADRAFLVR